MRFPKRTLGSLLIGIGALVLVGPAGARLFAHPPGVRSRADSAPRVDAAEPNVAGGQEQAPNRRELTITAKDYSFTPARLEVTQDDLVKLTIKSEDVAYSITIDAYRISKRVPAGGETTFEFRADRTGTFPFYSNLTTDSRHARAKGELVVRAR